MSEPAIRSWREMYAEIAERLKRQTGDDVETWNARIRAQGSFKDGPSLKYWLRLNGVLGYPAMLLGYETFGYPAYTQLGAAGLLDGQYRDRPQLRPIFDGITEVAASLGEVRMQARKTFVTFLGPRRTFAAVQAATRSHVDLGLRLDGRAASERLKVATSMRQGSMTHQVAVSAVDEIDDQVKGWLRTAYASAS